MKITLYHSKQKYREVVDYFSNQGDASSSNNYSLVGNELRTSEKTNKIIGKDGKQSDTLKICARLFLKKDESQIPVWLSDIQTIFDVKDPFKQGTLRYSSVIVMGVEILCSENVLEEYCFIIPNGQGFREAEKFADLDFGLDFAGRAIRKEKIDLKTSSFTQRNKLRAVVNYKSDQNEYPQASESYFYLSGRPIQADVFGKSIDCGIAVKFSNSYGLEPNEKTIGFASLIESVILTMKSEVITDIPRAREVEANSELERSLNEKLWKMLSGVDSSDDEYSLEYNMSRILLNGEKVTVMDNNYELYIYSDRPSKENRERVDYSEGQIEKYIREKKVQALDKIKFVLLDEHGQRMSKALNIQKLLCCELYLTKPISDMNNQLFFLLDNGRWKFFSKTFFDILEEKIENIDIECKKDGSSFIVSKTKLIEMGTQEINEDVYIDWLVSEKEDRVKLHRILVGNAPTKVEIADVYDKTNDELIAIKMGLDTKDSMYSMEQSNLSINALKNNTEFGVSGTLIENGCSKEETTSILNCKNSSILWVLKKSPVYAYNQVKEGSFKLGNIKSLLVKLKIVDWYTYCREHQYTPKIYITVIDYD